MGEWGEKKQRKYSRSENASRTRRTRIDGSGIRLSLLLAHTCTPDRRKSFISTHIVNDPQGGGAVFFKNGLCETRAGDY